MSSQDLKKGCGGTSHYFRRNKGKRLRDELSPDIFQGKNPGASYNPYQTIQHPETDTLVHFYHFLFFFLVT